MSPQVPALLAVLLLGGCCHVGSDAERSYFAALNAELRATGVGRPVAVIDLDRLDHNLQVVAGRLKDPLHFRAVEKSLPSVELLDYILQKTGSHRVMAFHHPFLPALLTRLPADTDLLFGKTIPVAGVAEVYARLTPEQRVDAGQRVQWLIDSPKTLEEYLAYFKSIGGKFCASVEIDVGLHRGGAQSEEQLEPILALIAANPDTVTFTGLMGYDGHAAHVPVPGFMLRWAIRKTVEGVQETYGRFWTHVQQRHPKLAATVRALNGGGSNTYALYEPGSVISDLSLGSALLKPAAYDVLTLEEHLPAVFIATPILKKSHPAMLPFLGRASFSSVVDGYYIYGGGWGSQVVHPLGLEQHPLMAGNVNSVLISNQSFLYGEAIPAVEPGDFVFYRPDQSDEVFLFDEIRLLRGGKLVGSFRPFESRY